MTQSPATETIRGLLERVTYCNEENGYSVWRVSVKGWEDPVTAVGHSPSRIPGEELELVGNWTEHPRFGRQFAFTECRSILPSSVEGIRRYLGSGLIKGLGPKTAERIVEKFGERTFDVLDNSPDDLGNITGIGKKLLDSVKESWNAQKAVRNVMVFLQSGGVSPNFAAKIFAAYGSDTIEIVRENPYRLAQDIFGIGFLTADKFAMNMGVEPTSPLRLDAGVLHALSEMAGEGHVCMPRDKLVAHAAKLLQTDEDMAASAIERSVLNNTIVANRFGSDEQESIYLPPYYITERKSAMYLADMLRDGLNIPGAGYGEIDAEMARSWARDCMHIELAENQAEALRIALSAKASIITGGPGTGKTTIIRAIVGICEARGMNVTLCAPTGRASKRMSEATGHEAKTIHRLLEYSGAEGAFARGPDCPLECDLLIVDEASMIDQILMFHLLQATPKAARLILVGDIHQLPSVGPGNVLKDLIASEAIPVAELVEIFRQAKESSIVTNAHRVNNGLIPVEPNKGGLRDFYFIEQEDPEKCLATILSLVTDRIPARFGLDPVEDIQILTPMHKGTLGSSNLNNVLQKALNPEPGETLEQGGRTFKAGDKVMQIRNNYDRDVFNGDIGLIVRVHKEANLVTACFDGREIDYASSDLFELVHAYAVSIHKSQGSEYPAVVIPIHTQHYVLLQRNLLYTGITRGKELVVLVGTRKAMQIAVQNDKTKHRYTHLDTCLRNMLR